jgi:hypothetical protein
MLKKIAVDVAVIGIIFIAALGVCANDQINPAQYPETVTVMAESNETATADSGTTYASKPKTNILGRPETDIVGRPTGATTTVAHTHVGHWTYCQAQVTIKDITYLINGRRNAPCVPLGTFKAKITNGQYIDILVTQQGGNPYSVGFEIIRSERNLPTSSESTALPNPQQKEEATPAVASVSAPEVAEVARQARIAKAVKEAKEKAERDNPPPPQ